MDEYNDENVEDTRQWLKFGILAGILLITVLVVALIRPLIFNRIVPAVMGGDGQTAVVAEPVIEESVIEEPAVDSEENVVGSEEPAVGSEETAVGSEETAVGSEETAVGSEETAVTHIVESGETIYSIAREYEVTPQSIIEANNLSSPDSIMIGSELLINK